MAAEGRASAQIIDLTDLLQRSLRKNGQAAGNEGAAPPTRKKTPARTAKAPSKTTAPKPPARRAA